MNQPAIVKPCLEKTLQHEGATYRFNLSEVASFSPQMLDSKYWQSEQLIVGSAQGRGTTWFINPQQASINNEQWVLRHYYRGGLIGKIINDQYLYTGLANTRAAREFALLQTLQDLGLPAPKPIAFKVITSGIFYRADLLSSRIENANDLVAILSKNKIDNTNWHRIGKVIASFHQQGIYHHDLNAHNILLDDQQKIWLIDFDQGEKREIKQQWQESNLARLHRSFRKEQLKIANFQWDEENWLALLEGYHA